MTHAGFWIDGAVRLPERRHGDSEGDVLIKIKSNSLDLFLEPFGDVTSGYYWLDTTPRESLTPEELWSVLILVWAGCGQLHKSGDDSWYIGQIEKGIRVDWGNLTQYPPPIEPQWVRITRENVGQYLFRECRFRDLDFQEWKVGKVSGWDEQDGCCLVNSDFNEDMPIMQWNIVEVQA